MNSNQFLAKEKLPSLSEKQGLKEWVKEIKKNWQEIGEFKISPEKLKHLAIICDGNRRAANKRNLHPYFGHRAGIETIRGIAKACRKWGLYALSFWIWSTENWQREKQQVKYIMNLATRFLKDSQLRKEILENKVHFTHLGRKDRLPAKILRELKNLEKETNKFNRHQLNLAMDYGGLDEIVRTMAKLNQLIAEGKLRITKILENHSLIFDYLDTANQPLPDLVIRTGTQKGELPHTSGFMPLQTAYSCWQFIPDLFPELTPKKLLSTIKEFLTYQRRFGR